MVRVAGWVGLTRKKHGSGHESTRFCFESKKSDSSQVFFGSGQKILTRFAMSMLNFRVFLFLLKQLMESFQILKTKNINYIKLIGKVF